MIGRTPARPLALALLATLSILLPGCSTAAFYSQAISGQAEILAKARPVSAVLADERVPDSVKRKLAVIGEVRRFAEDELLLPAGRQYDRYTDLHRQYASWVVYAVPEFSIEGKTWWYPIVGRLEYRGYFHEKDARLEAARTKDDGYEVYVGGVEAYSTLGWFRDPVLNTFLHRSDAELAELIIHELTHVKLFIRGDTDFNEALATANAQEGVRRWLKAKGCRAALSDYDATLKKDRQLIETLLNTRRKLGLLYNTRSIDAAAMRREKQVLLRQLHQQLEHIGARSSTSSTYRRVVSVPWTNARLNTVATYYGLVPGFERLLKEHDGDLASFYEAVRRMERLSQSERRALLGGGSFREGGR